MKRNKSVDMLLRAILAIADNRPPARSKLNANLVAATGLWTNLEQCESSESIEPLERKDTFLSDLTNTGHGDDIAFAIFHQSIVQITLTSGYRAFHKGEVRFLNTVNSELFREPACSLTSPGKQHHARDGSIESMHDPHENVPRLLIFFSKIVARHLDESRFTRVITHGEQTRWLVERQAMVVLMQDYVHRILVMSAARVRMPADPMSLQR